MSALGEIHQALYTRLANDAPLAQAGYGVYDEPPGLEAQASYVAIGEATEARGGPQSGESHSQRSYEVTETLHIWYRGNSSISAKRGLELVRAAIESAPLNVAGHGVGLCRYEFSTVMREPGWRHIPARFRIVVGSPLPV